MLVCDRCKNPDKLDVHWGRDEAVYLGEEKIVDAGEDLCDQCRKDFVAHIRAFFGPSDLETRLAEVMFELGALMQKVRPVGCVGLEARVTDDARGKLMLRLTVYQGGDIWSKSVAGQLLEAIAASEEKTSEPS